MPKRRKKTARDAGRSDLFADRASLIVYLQYALDELTLLDETSAGLIQMAILNLQDENSPSRLDYHNPRLS
jgi:hypothetical protein